MTEHFLAGVLEAVVDDDEAKTPSCDDDEDEERGLMNNRVDSSCFFGLGGGYSLCQRPAVPVFFGAGGEGLRGRRSGLLERFLGGGACDDDDG